MRQFYFFCLVGGLGFICDYIVFSTVSIFINAYIAKTIGFICAVHLTYFINKSMTFRDHTAIYIVYILGQIKGFLINMLIFGLIYFFTKKQNIGFFIASGLTLIFNFYYAKYFAFKAKIRNF